LIKFSFYFREKRYLPLSFIATFTNLQEINLIFNYTESLEDFKKLQYITFSQLQNLRISSLSSPKLELLINFLEINGKTLRELYLRQEDIIMSPNSVTKLCPNLRKLSISFESNELEALKTVFNDCQYLESLLRFGQNLVKETKFGNKIFLYR